jgi:WD40 repeat protein
LTVHEQRIHGVLMPPGKKQSGMDPLRSVVDLLREQQQQQGQEGQSQLNLPPRHAIQSPFHTSKAVHEDGKRGETLGNAPYTIPSSERTSAVLTGHAGAVCAVAWHPTRPLVASASEDHTLRLWSTQFEACTATLKQHNGPVFACAFSPDGESLVSASQDRTLKIWRLEPEPVVMSTLRGHKGPVRSCAYSPNARRAPSLSPPPHPS